MDGQNIHGYLQEDNSYDDLLNTSNWPASNEQQYSYSQPTQDQYRFPTSQTSFDHFDMSQQQSYPQVTYSNSPYASQYQQHARPSDVFNQNSYIVDPSLQGSGGYGQDNTFSFAPQRIENATISPQSLQYNLPQSRATNGGVNVNSFQRSVSNGLENFGTRPQNPSPVYLMEPSTTKVPQQHALPPQQQRQPVQVQYPALPPAAAAKQSISRIMGETTPVLNGTQQYTIPPKINPLRVIQPEMLAEGSTSQRLAYAPFVTWEETPLQVASGPKTKIPPYKPRKSQSGRELIPGFDISHALAPAKSTTKKIKSEKPPKKQRVESTYKGTSGGPRVAPDKLNGVREDGVLTGRSPSTSPESDSEDETSSEEESEDEEDKMPPLHVNSIRGDIRPSDPVLGAKWDAIGIVWHDEAYEVHSNLVKECIEKFGTLITSFRTQIKDNASKIEAAAARPAELSKLQLERQVLLDSLYETINAANEHGYGPLVENLGNHLRLVNGLTTTLIDCVKADDYKGKLPKAVFTLLAKFQTLTDELLKKLKFEGLQKRWMKKGDDDTKKLIVKILANTVDAKEKASGVKIDSIKREEDKKARPVEQVKKPVLSAVVSNPAKRPHGGSIGNEPPTKKVDLKPSGVSTTTSKPTAPKRPLSNLLGIASKPVAKTVKKRELSPPTTSKFGALLASIEKPPEPPKAPAAPKRPPETPEEKARRERKESRRHLRVKFREGDALEEVRLFKHEQAEDEGRQDEMLRDAHDTHHEGMMHKMRILEAVDDDDEYQPPDVEVPYTEPKAINLDSVSKSTSHGDHYITRAGILPVNSVEQKTQARREGLELMVVYTNPEDIPPSPREPSAGTEVEMDTERDYQQPTDPVIVQRLQEIQLHGQQSAFQNFLSRREERTFHDLRDNRGNAQSFAINKSDSTPSQQAQREAMAHQQAAAQEAAAALAFINNIVDQHGLRGRSYPPKEVPLWIQNPARRGSWISGYNRDHPNSPIIEKQQLADIEVQPQAPVYHPPPPIMPPQFQAQFPPPIPFPPPSVPQQTQANTQHPDVTQQVAALLAGYTNGQAYLPPPPATTQAFDYAQWYAQLQGGQGSQPSIPFTTQPQNGAQPYPPPSRQPEPSTYENRSSNTNPNSNEASKPRWDDRGDNWTNGNENHNEERESKKKRGGNRGHNPKQKSGSDGLFDENGEYKGKKKPCKFYQLGQCAKGAACTYLHDDNF